MSDTEKTENRVGTFTRLLRETKDKIKALVDKKDPVHSSEAKVIDQAVAAYEKPKTK